MTQLIKIKKLYLHFKHRRMLRRLGDAYISFVETPENSAWGSITSADEEGVEQAVRLASRHEGPIVEIGALFGHTTNMLSALKADNVQLVTVENFSWNPFFLPPEAHRQFLKRTLRYAMARGSTKIFDGDAASFYSQNASLKPSLVFIDAAHDYKSVSQDIAWALASGCPIIAGHDYATMHPGVVKAVDEAFGRNVMLFGSVWIHNRGR